ncbi:hypothetical protein BC628DRAFT_489117 [Trametes gibbosa]|nr:hypothetical protein BC628DRAFT_489117 [Trametes gibbosa]
MTLSTGENKPTRVMQSSRRRVSMSSSTCFFSHTFGAHVPHRARMRAKALVRLLPFVIRTTMCPAGRSLDSVLASRQPMTESRAHFSVFTFGRVDDGLAADDAIEAQMHSKHAQDRGFCVNMSPSSLKELRNSIAPRATRGRHRTFVSGRLYPCRNFFLADNASAGSHGSSRGEPTPPFLTNERASGVCS